MHLKSSLKDFNPDLTAVRPGSALIGEYGVYYSRGNRDYMASLPANASIIGTIGAGV